MPAVDTDDAPAVPGWAASFTGYDEDEEGSCGDEDDDAIPELLDTDANDDSDIDATLPALLHQESSDSEGGDIGDTGDGGSDSGAPLGSPALEYVLLPA